MWRDQTSGNRILSTPQLLQSLPKRTGTPPIAHGPEGEGEAGARVDPEPHQSRTRVLLIRHVRSVRSSVRYWIASSTWLAVMLSELPRRTETNPVNYPGQEPAKQDAPLPCVADEADRSACPENLRWEKKSSTGKPVRVGAANHPQRAHPSPSSFLPL